MTSTTCILEPVLHIYPPVVMSRALNSHSACMHGQGFSQGVFLARHWLNFSMSIKISEVKCYARAENFTEVVASIVATPLHLK